MLAKLTRIDKQLAKQGYKKIGENKYGVMYRKINYIYDYTQRLDIRLSASGYGFIVSFRESENDDNHASVAMNYQLTKIAIKKLKQMKRKYGWD